MITGVENGAFNIPDVYLPVIRKDGNSAVVEYGTLAADIAQREYGVSFADTTGPLAERRENENWCEVLPEGTTYQNVAEALYGYTANIYFPASDAEGLPYRYFPYEQGDGLATKYVDDEEYVFNAKKLADHVGINSTFGMSVSVFGGKLDEKSERMLFNLRGETGADVSTQANKLVCNGDLNIPVGTITVLSNKDGEVTSIYGSQGNIESALKEGGVATLTLGTETGVKGRLNGEEILVRPTDLDGKHVNVRYRFGIFEAVPADGKAIDYLGRTSDHEPAWLDNKNFDLTAGLTVLGKPDLEPNTEPDWERILGLGGIGVVASAGIVAFVAWRHRDEIAEGEWKADQSIRNTSRLM